MVGAKTRLMKSINAALKEYIKSETSARIRRGIEFAKKKKQK